MDENVLVSIITVCYNSEKTIEQTIRSVLNQTYSNIEYLIIDGKSTDHTIDIAGKYQEKFKGRMKIVSEPDEGIYDAMNKGIKMTSGKLIGIINSDDFYEIDAVENIVDAYQKLEADVPVVLYGMLRTLKNEKEAKVSISSHEFLEDCMIGHPTCFITKSAYDNYGVYDTNYCSAADYDLMLRYKKSGEVLFIPVYKIIANFRSGGMCSTHKAYLDLLKLQRNYHIISEKKYKTAKLKAVLSEWLHR